MTFLMQHGATKKEATQLIMAEQFREIDRLNRYLTEAVAAMDTSETDKFFGVGEMKELVTPNDVR
jgi:hypothetical protein